MQISTLTILSQPPNAEEIAPVETYLVLISRHWIKQQKMNDHKENLGSASPEVWPIHFKKGLEPHGSMGQGFEECTDACGQRHPCVLKQ
jgi:hypothetical protein